MIITVGILLLSVPILAGVKSQPVFRPSLQISRVSGSIDIDGRLIDPGWRTAAKIDNFVERNPGDNIPPDVSTEVYVTYDDAKLYIAFVCADDPNEVRATMSQRDQWSGNDGVIVMIDTYGNAGWAYEFFVNPYGIQKDLLWSSVMGMEDSGYDLIWESAAQKTESGYIVEMAIPFTSMRFPDRDIQTWKMDFWRNRPRESTHQYSWAAYDRNEQCWPCQWGTVEGIKDVHPGKGIEILPAYVANQIGELNGLPGKDVKFENHDAQGELALNGKYTISSDITAEAAYNPDFSQIEADAAQIDINSTIALMYPERRPYFQEGSDIFRTMFNSFYTRTINDPQYTAKMTGRMGKNTVGFLFARDDNSPYMIPLNQSNLLFDAGKSTSNILRASHSFGQSSRLGFMLNDRRFDGNGSNTVLSLDGLLRLSKSYAFDFQFIGTHTKEQNNPSLTADDIAALAYYGYDTTFNHGKNTIALDGESFYGSAFITRVYSRARHLNWMIDYNQLDRTYRTETGYDPVINQRTFDPSASFTFYFDKGLLQRLVPHVSKFNRWDFDGNMENDGLNFGLDGILSVMQASFNANYNIASRAYNFQRFDGLRDASIFLSGNIRNRINLGLYYNWGRDINYSRLKKGDYTNCGFSIYLKPIDRITIEPNFDFTRMVAVDNKARYYNGYITRTRIQFQATKELSFRLVTQYNDFGRSWDLDPLMTFRVNSFSVFYVGSTYDYGDIAPMQRRALSQNDIPTTWKMTSRQYFMKLQYLFRT